MIPQTNQIYRHFKGNLYRVITVAEHTENGEQLVIYQALYGEYKVFARPLPMFMSEVDREKYPDVIQQRRFEPVEQVIQPVNAVIPSESMEEQSVEKDKTVQEIELITAEEGLGEQPVSDMTEEMSYEQSDIYAAEENIMIDPLLEAYLDTDSYREKLNILHGLQHRITEHMLNTMAIVIDFELPEGDITTKYNALHDCILTKEKYECNRMV